jgi:EAL domain-containing protein (putative c-di-GMP-specific phosphodiesterase class I)
MDVVAEGVETVGQLDALRDLSCRFFQGWLFGRPMPLPELRIALESFDPLLLDTRPAPDLDTAVH